MWALNEAQLLDHSKHTIILGRSDRFQSWSNVIVAKKNLEPLAGRSSVDVDTHACPDYVSLACRGAFESGTGKKYSYIWYGMFTHTGTYTKFSI